jgi:hypothetical protein
VAADNPVKSLEKLPVTEPSVVFELAVVGSAVILQHIPLTEIVAPPLEEMVPPEVAYVWLIVVTAAVVSVGTAIEVENVCSFP